MATDIITKIDNIRVAGYEDLSKRGKSLYRAKCQELMKEGELRKCHLQTLILWADNYDRYFKLRKEVDKEGETFSTTNKFGDKVVSANPKVKMMNDAMKVADAILREFGSTLKQSRKLGKGQETEDPLDGWLGDKQ